MHFNFIGMAQFRWATLSYDSSYYDFLPKHFQLKALNLHYMHWSFFCLQKKTPVQELPVAEIPSGK